MKNHTCRRCGNSSLIREFISVRCPICGTYSYMQDAGVPLLWSEHRLGLMFARGGWQWLGVIEPPSWFVANVV
jgi:uncharacterized protein (DUF983 family)